MKNVVRVIMVMVLMMSMSMGKTIDSINLNKTRVVHWRGNGQITYSLVPRFVKYKGKTIKLTKDERAKIAQVLNIVAIGETGLGGKFNTNGWYSRCRGRGHNVKSYTIGQLLYIRGCSATGMFQIIKKVMREEIRIQKLNRRSRYTPKMQVRIITNRMIRIRGLLEYIRGEMNVWEFCRNMAKEFASIEDPKLRRSYYRQRVGVTYARFKRLSKKRNV